MISLNTGWNLGYGWYFNQFSSWREIWTAQAPAFQLAWFEGIAGFLVLSLVTLLLAMIIAAWSVARSWRDQPASAKQIWLLETFCTPRLWRRIFRHKMERLLERNPIGWLQQHAWSARLNRWLWCLVLLVAEWILVNDQRLSYIWTGQRWLAQLLLLNIAFVAAGSFRLEKEIGFLELWLVTPLKVGQIIQGRLLGLWGQFIPAAVMLGATWLYLAGDAELYRSVGDYNNPWLDRSNLAYLPFLLASTFLVLPIIGLCLSLQPWPFLLNWLLTMLLGVAVPWFIFWWGNSLGLKHANWIQFSLQVILALLSYYWLHRNLTRREFARIRK